MTLECINPKDLPTPQTYTQVVVATGSKMVFVSGQEPEDIHGKLVGPGDLATQASQVFGNLGRALAAAGARPAQVTRITIYVVNYKRDECLPIIEKARIALFGDHNECRTVEVTPNILKNECFSRRIKTRSCFVEDQNPRLLQKGSCDSKPLT